MQVLCIFVMSQSIVRSIWVGIIIADGLFIAYMSQYRRSGYAKARAQAWALGHAIGLSLGLCLGLSLGQGPGRAQA